MTSRARPEHLKVPGQFLSSRFKPHIVPLATYQYTFPNTIYLTTLFTRILFCHNSPALYVTTTGAAYGGQNASIVGREAKSNGGPPLACPESQESQEENELEQHGDDEDQFADWGGAERPIGHGLRKSQASILKITSGNT